MDTALKVAGLCGGYDKSDVIKDVTFEARKGEFLGIIGPNGSGKSTLLRLITRELPVSRGSVSLDGADIASISPKAFARRVAFVPQETAINFAFSVSEIVLMGRIPHLGRLQPEGVHDRAIADNALSITDTLDIRDKEIDSLSTGERQRVIIAKALAQEPSLLVLDEPTSHLDIGHQIMILDLLKRLNADRQLTIIMVVHDLNLAAEYCDRLILIDHGSIFKQGRPDEVLTYENIESVYKTVVVVNRNPISSKPQIVLVSGDQLCRHG